MTFKIYTCCSGSDGVRVMAALVFNDAQGARCRGRAQIHLHKHSSGLVEIWGWREGGALIFANAYVVYSKVR